MIYKRSAPSLHSNASQGVDVALWKPWVVSWSNGRMWEHCHERLHPTCGSGDIHLPKTNFPRGQSDFELSKRLAAMFQLVPSSTAFCIFSQFWRELGKDFLEPMCKNRLWLLHFSISSSSCWVIWAQFWALPQICSVTWGKVAYSLFLSFPILKHSW